MKNQIISVLCLIILLFGCSSQSYDKSKEETLTESNNKYVCESQAKKNPFEKENINRTIIEISKMDLSEQCLDIMQLSCNENECFIN